jgi:hypothetical protein
MIRHHPEASLASCDHPMWIIWGHDRHHHALTAHKREWKRGRWSGTRSLLSAAPGPPRVAPVPTSRLRVVPGAPRVPAAPAPTSRHRAALGVPHVPTAPTPTSRLRAAPGAPCVPTAPAPTSRRGAALGAPHVSTAPTSTSWLRAALGAPCVPTAPAPASWHRAALGTPHVPGSHLLAQGSSGGATCPHGSSTYLPPNVGSR